MYKYISPYDVFEQGGGGGIIFVTPWSNIFGVYESWWAENTLSIVIEVDSLKRELLQYFIVSREYPYTLKKLSHFW